MFSAGKAVAGFTVLFVMPRVTMAIIAEKAGVSKNTVSLALRHDPQIPPHTRKRIAKIAKSLGYTKNPVVAQLMTELRKAHPAGYRRTLALLNANLDQRARSLRTNAQFLLQFTIEGDPHGLTVLHLAAGKLPQTALVFVIGSPGDQDASIDTPNHRCCDMHTLHPFTSCNAA